MPDTEAWWRAVNWIIDVAETETIQGARKVTANPHMVIAAVGAGEGIDLVRTKLKEAREAALRGRKTNAIH